MRITQFDIPPSEDAVADLRKAIGALVNLAVEVDLNALETEKIFNTVNEEINKINTIISDIGSIKSRLSDLEAQNGLLWEEIRYLREDIS